MLHVGTILESAMPFLTGKWEDVISKASSQHAMPVATLSLSVAWLVVCKHRNIEEYMLITYFYGNSMITLGTLGF